MFKELPLLREAQKSQSGREVDDENGPGQQVGVAVVEAGVVQHHLVEGVEGDVALGLDHLEVRAVENNDCPPVLETIQSYGQTLNFV